MTTCRKNFTFSWPLRGRGGGRPKRSAWPLLSRFFCWLLPLLCEETCPSCQLWLHFLRGFNKIRLNHQYECKSAPQTWFLLFGYNAVCVWWMRVTSRHLTFTVKSIFLTHLILFQTEAFPVDVWQGRTGALSRGVFQAAVKYDYKYKYRY